VIKIQYRGRLGNRMIQYAAAYVLAKKTGLQLDARKRMWYRNEGIYKTSSSENDVIITDFGFVFKNSSLSGNIFNELTELTDDNYFEHLQNPTPNKGYHLDGFFQHEKLLVDYREEILNLYKCDVPCNGISSNDCFIHARIGDLLNNPWREMAYFNPDYLEQQLQTKRTAFDKVYISSDTINYPPLVELINKYGLTIYQNEPLDTILFAKNFNNFILSAGSFSYWMAYLSSAENITVYHNEFHDPLQKHNAWAYNKNVRFTK